MERVSCGVCGNPDVHYVFQDIQEVEPVKDKEGRLWADWEPMGDPRYGCKGHRPRRCVWKRRGET